MKTSDDICGGVTVYCGSCEGDMPWYAAGARAIGAALAEAGVPLIYGGGRMGLMHATADACRRAGGETLAVIPRFMVDKGWLDTDTTYTIVAADMGERKKTFAARSRGVIALPGGVGTLEELAEIITWRKLGIFTGNIVIYNPGGYYDPFLAQLAACTAHGFMRDGGIEPPAVTDDPAEAVRLAIAPR